MQSKKSFLINEAKKIGINPKEFAEIIKKLKLKLVKCHCIGVYHNCSGYDYIDNKNLIST